MNLEDKRRNTMPSIEPILEKMFKDKKVPVKKNKFNEDQVVFSGAYRIAEDKTIPFNVVAREFKEGSSVTEYQITYRKLVQVEDFNNQTKALAVINEINLKRAGYYTLILTGDGEIYLRLLSRTTEDPQLLYELMVFGSATARLVYPELEEKINGKKVQVLQTQPKAE